MSTKKITAHLPSSVDLTRLGSANALRIEVILDDAKAGELHLAQGGVEWWPGGHSIQAHRISWAKLIETLKKEPLRKAKGKR